MPKSSRKRASRKPAKSRGFPLGEHPSGRWCRKIKKKFHYFGKVVGDESGQQALAALDRDGGWLDYARGKTAIPRRISLWPETVEAIRAALKKRPTPADEA